MRVRPSQDFRWYTNILYYILLYDVGTNGCLVNSSAAPISVVYSPLFLQNWIRDLEPPPARQRAVVVSGRLTIKGA